MGRRKYSDDQVAEFTAYACERTLWAVGQADRTQYEAGFGWYSHMHEEGKLLAHAAGITLDQAIGVIAALSPRVRWVGNIEDAWAVCTGGDVRHALPANVEKARRILAGEPIADVLGGDKVTSFNDNGLNPLTSDAITLDTWMRKLFGASEGDLFDKSYVYEAYAEGVRQAAAILGIRGLQAQAIAWVVVRDAGMEEEAFGADLPNPYGKVA